MTSAASLQKPRRRRPAIRIPNTPPVPGLLKIADAAEAAVDALRDAITGRG